MLMYLTWTTENLDKKRIYTNKRCHLGVGGRLYDTNRPYRSLEIRHFCRLNQKYERANVGGEHQKQWTQQIYKVKNGFQNPLHQNHRHIKALEEVLELSPSWIFSVVVFVGECDIMTPMPLAPTLCIYFRLSHAGTMIQIRYLICPIWSAGLYLDINWIVSCFDFCETHPSKCLQIPNFQALPHLWLCGYVQAFCQELARVSP